MRVSVLTSSRADYGIYMPLLIKLKEDAFFDLNIIAFGTHLSPDYGYTLKNIEEDGFEVQYKLETVVDDSPRGVAQSMSKTIDQFAQVWEQESGKTDLIICLGDRYEMFAAVSASVPFGIPVAHIHGGETTLGAIDNVFRHGLTQMSTLHFVSAEPHGEKVVELIGEKANVHNVGSLSLDNLKSFDLLSVEKFEKQFGIDLSKPTVLVTFHPETVSFDKNEVFADEVANAFEQMTNYQIVITMPNADTMGNVIRKRFEKLAEENSHVLTVENFGIRGYFSIMKMCQFLIGNTSSGIIEAASFHKHVINLGDRQKGRSAGDNVHHVNINADEILNKVEEVSILGDYQGANLYEGMESASDLIIKALKQYNHGGE